MNAWITINPVDTLFYAAVIFVIMLIIFFVFYLLSIFDSRRINAK